MSVPQHSKKTDHKVIRVNDESIQMYTILINVIIITILMITALYTAHLVEKQQKTIDQLTHVVNSINYKVSLDNLKNPDLKKAQQLKMSNDNHILQHIEANFEFQIQQIKSIKARLNEIREDLQVTQKSIQKLFKQVDEQSKSAWEMKQIIQSIKNKLQSFTEMISSISIPKPDLSSMKDSIKGTFSNLKTKIGGMFSSGDEDSESMSNSNKPGESIKEKVKRKWEEANKQQRKYKQQL